MKAITKLNENQMSELIELHAHYRVCMGDNDLLSATAFKNQILGYLNGLVSTKQITSTDKESLLIYFTKTASLK